MFDLSKYTLPLRIVELVLGLLVLALMSAVAHYFNIADEPAFLLFCGVWGFLASIFLLILLKKTPTSWPQKVTACVIAGVDVLTCIFFFAGFIAAAAVTVDCDNYFSSRATSYCRVFNAAIAFGAFSWACWTITSIITVPQAVSAVTGAGAATTTAAATNNVPAGAPVTTITPTTPAVVNATADPNPAAPVSAPLSTSSEIRKPEQQPTPTPVVAPAP